jgi:branched-chain amino acid transport system substrate-binding protein
MCSSVRVLLSVLFLCSAAAVAQAAELHLGVSMSLTGKYAQLGAMNEKAYRLWEKDVNRRGGILGHNVRLTIVDDQSDPVRARQIYEDLIVRQKVDLVLGPYSSEITEAVSDIAEQYRYPLLSSGGSADSMWQKGRKYLFGVYITASKYSIGMLELLVRADIGRIAIVATDDSFGKAIQAGTLDWARRFEVPVISSSDFKKGTPDIELRIRAAHASGADVLMIAGHFDDSVNARQALKKIGWTPKVFYATVGPAIQKYADVLKADADYAFSSSQWEPGLSFPGTREFAKAFTEAYKIEPSYHAASAYAAGQILEAAIRKTHSLDREKLRDTLSSLDTMTVMGRYGVDRDGKQVRHFAVTVQWQKGKKEIVAPAELATAKPVWR